MTEQTTENPNFPKYRLSQGSTPEEMIARGFIWKDGMYRMPETKDEGR